MRNIIGALAATLICGCLAVAQQTPPADGIGLGETQHTTDSNASGTPTVSPDQNQAITGTRGSTKGTSNEPGFAGSSGAQSGSRMNSQGTGAASSSTAATDARRRTSSRRKAKHQGQSRAQGQQSASKSGSGTDQLLAPNMGPSTTEAPGPNTGNRPEKQPPQ